MALFPCVVGSHRYVGRQNSAYLGLVNGAEAARSKIRLCNRHCQDLIEWLNEAMTLIAIGDIGQADNDVANEGCASCGASNPAWNAFANVYQAGSEPRVYFAPLCEGHVATFAERAQIAI
jgi:hypothetical protein